MDFGSDVPNQVLRDDFCEVDSYQDGLVRLFHRCINMSVRRRSCGRSAGGASPSPSTSTRWCSMSAAATSRTGAPTCCSIATSGDEHGGQRSGASAARVDRPLFDADAADMPFADKVFDYAICSHVLEHVERPDAVIAELDACRQGRLHRGARGRERQDRRLPQPPVVGHAGRRSAGVHGQVDCRTSTPTSIATSPTSGMRQTAGGSARQTPRPPRHRAALDRHRCLSSRGLPRPSWSSRLTSPMPITAAARPSSAGS